MLFPTLGRDPIPTQVANLDYLVHWISPRGRTHMKNPSHSKSCHMQCRCYPIQVQRTSRTMKIFLKVGSATICSGSSKNGVTRSMSLWVICAELRRVGNVFLVLSTLIFCTCFSCPFLFFRFRYHSMGRRVSTPT